MGTDAPQATYAVGRGKTVKLHLIQNTVTMILKFKTESR